MQPWCNSVIISPNFLCFSRSVPHHHAKIGGIYRRIYRARYNLSSFCVLFCQSLTSQHQVYFSLTFTSTQQLFLCIPRITPSVYVAPTVLLPSFALFFPTTSECVFITAVHPPPPSRLMSFFIRCPPRTNHITPRPPLAVNLVYTSPRRASPALELYVIPSFKLSEAAPIHTLCPLVDAAITSFPIPGFILHCCPESSLYSIFRVSIAFSSFLYARRLRSHCTALYRQLLNHAFYH